LQGAVIVKAVTPVPTEFDLDDA